MKIILLLCLLTLFSCKIDLIETAKCLISQPKIKELGLQIFNHIKSKDFSKILQTLMNSLPDLYNNLTKCLSEPDDENVILKAPPNCKHPFNYSVCEAIYKPMLVTYKDFCTQLACED